MRAQAMAKMFEHARQQEGKRFEQQQRVVKFDDFFENLRRVDWDQRARGGSARQLLQSDAGLSQSLTYRNFRQSSKRAQIANAPTPQSFQVNEVGSGKTEQHIEGKTSQPLVFSA